MTGPNMSHPGSDGNGNLPAGFTQEYFEARQIVGKACVAASGAGIPVEMVASAAIGAIVEMMVEKCGDERLAVQTITGFVKAYEVLAGEGLSTSGTPFTLLARG